jgi:hypothetical protein
MPSLLFGWWAIDSVTATNNLRKANLQVARIRKERSVCRNAIQFGLRGMGREVGSEAHIFRFREHTRPSLPMLEGLNCVRQAKAPASFAIDSLYAMRGQIRSVGDFIVAKQSESDPGGCPLPFSPENEVGSSTHEPPTEIFPSVSWVEFDDFEAKGSTSMGAAKSLMKTCTTTSTTTKKKRRNMEKEPSEDDLPPCLPYIIIG